MGWQAKCDTCLKTQEYDEELEEDGPTGWWRMERISMRVFGELSVLLFCSQDCVSRYFEIVALEKKKGSSNG